MPAQVSFLPFLHPQHLVSILLPQLGVDTLVDAHRVHGESDGQQAMHLLILFVDLRNHRSSIKSVSKRIFFDNVKECLNEHV